MKESCLTKETHGSIERANMLKAELAKVLPVLIKECKPLLVYLYGSLASGSISEWSDIDLIIVRETNKRFLDRSAEVLSLLCPRVGMDITVYTPTEWREMVTSRPFIQQEVIEKGICLHEAA